MSSHRSQSGTGELRQPQAATTFPRRRAGQDSRPQSDRARRKAVSGRARSRPPARRARVGRHPRAPARVWRSLGLLVAALLVAGLVTAGSSTPRCRRRCPTRMRPRPAGATRPPSSRPQRPPPRQALRRAEPQATSRSQKMPVDAAAGRHRHRGPALLRARRRRPARHRARARDRRRAAARRRRAARPSRSST